MNSINGFESSSVTQNNYRAERMAFFGANRATIKALLGTIPKAAETPLGTYRHISKKARNGCRATFLHQTSTKFMICNHLWIYFAQLTGEPLVSKPLACYVDEMLDAYSAVMDDYSHYSALNDRDAGTNYTSEIALAGTVSDIRNEINFTQFYTLLNRVSDNNIVPYTCKCGTKFIVLADRRGDRCPTCKVRHETKRRLAQISKVDDYNRVSRLPPLVKDNGVARYE